MREIKEYWMALFMAIADNDKTQMDSLALSDVFDFFTQLKVHESNQIIKQKQYNKNK